MPLGPDAGILALRRLAMPPHLSIQPPGQRARPFQLHLDGLDHSQGQPKRFLKANQVRRESMPAIAVDMAPDLAGLACKIYRFHDIS
jgi:hypothetical protein